jgi:alpha-D-ribose 1-methylphosphonate 5-triphosphate diphosphatase
MTRATALARSEPAARPDTAPLVFENALVVTADDAFTGHVVVQGDTILEVGRGRAPERGLDLDGDLLIPGLVELHTDHLESHVLPRPQVEWHIESAVFAYDAQIAASGITTVFDSLRIGSDEHETRSVGTSARSMRLAEAVGRTQAAGLLRAEHLTHLRCEVPTHDVVECLEAFLERFPVRMMSLMDHTPGQRQFRDLDKYFVYYGGKTGKSHEEVASIVAKRQEVGAARSALSRPRLVELAHAHGIALASHDDTTIEEVAQSAAEGVTIAEFPTTHESAIASREAGMATVMGGPNVVRGGSHSGNVAAQALAEDGLLDILSSDYVPASLLMGALHLRSLDAVGGLPGAIRLVTLNPARITGLDDRGEIAAGKRADLVRVTLRGETPLVRASWRCGQRIA